MEIVLSRTYHLPFYLLRNGDIHIAEKKKSELERTIESKLQYVLQYTVPSGNMNSMILIDFMALAKRVRVKSDDIKTFGEFCHKVRK